MKLRFNNFEMNGGACYFRVVIQSKLFDRLSERKTLRPNLYVVLLPCQTYYNWIRHQHGIFHV